ncbi:hypothetical protein [Alkalihalophilus marmarensis]|uniref:hypothetical protein n=1 Tax=Alkalihalophilus marmarensis TaxID=521377 RepID=UPI002E21B3AA|nr:hypothetical protein [Alkalihalophilus marmarensis]
MKRKLFKVMGMIVMIVVVALGISLWIEFDRHNEFVSLHEEMKEHYNPLRETVLHCAFGYFEGSHYDCSYTAMEEQLSIGENAISRFDATYNDTEQFQILLLKGISYAREVIESSLLLDPGADDFATHFNAGYEAQAGMLENEDEMYELMEKYFTFESNENEEE